MVMQSRVRHSHVEVEGVPIHVAEAGEPGRPALVLLHGWPENWAAFGEILALSSRDAHAIAIDLPGIGESAVTPRSNDKRTLAAYVHGLIHGLRLQHVTLVGHDIGAQIVSAYLRAYPDELTRAVMMNIAVPGIAPWAEVERDPRIWHFAFHAVPSLPERLVTGHVAAYFDFFYEAIAAHPGAIDAQTRRSFVEAYSRPEALKTGFDWYRAFPRDEKVNREYHGRPVSTPVLYLRGDREGSDIGKYLDGFREAGLRDLRGRVIADCGHFAPNEQPHEVVAAIREFIEPPS
jgi:pimeloyl-ACP methyl ester carboxylesterase